MIKSLDFICDLYTTKSFCKKLMHDLYINIDEGELLH